MRNRSAKDNFFGYGRIQRLTPAGISLRTLCRSRRQARLTWFAIIELPKNAIEFLSGVGIRNILKLRHAVINHHTVKVARQFQTKDPRRMRSERNERQYSTWVDRSFRLRQCSGGSTGNLPVASRGLAPC